MLGEKSKLLQTGRTDHPTSLKSRFGYANFISRAYLFEHRSTYFPKDDLSVLCKITYATDDVQDTEPKPSSKRQASRVSATNLLEELFASRAQPSIVFVVEGKEFPVHTAVLSLRSPIFKGLFARDLGGATRLEIRDMVQADFEEMLRVIHTGETKAVTEMTNNLIAAMMSSFMKKISTTKESSRVPTKEPIATSPGKSHAHP